VPATYALPEELTIYTLGELSPQCLQWLDADTEACLSVDAQAVSEVDAAGVQLLLSLANALAAQARELLLVAPSTTLVAACAALGAQGLIAPSPLEGLPV
jgi:anti-anti-sigma regulatory factor